MTSKRKQPARTAIEKIEDDLAYRLPQSGKPLSAIVLSREQAERLVEEFRELQAQIKS